MVAFASLLPLHAANGKTDSVQYTKTENKTIANMEAKDTVSYLLGFSTTSKLFGNPYQFDVESFLQGVRTALEGKDCGYSNEEFQQIVAQWQKDLKRKAQEKSMENKAKGKQFLADNLQNDKEIKQTASGLQYKIIKEGKGKNGTVCAAAIELPDGTIVTAHNSEMLHACSALLLNALKVMTGIPKERDLIAADVIKSITAMKRDILSGKGVSMNLDEILIALAMSASVSEDAAKAMKALPLLKNAEVHLTHIPSPGDSSGIRKLGILATSDPRYPVRNI